MMRALAALAMVGVVGTLFWHALALMGRVTGFSAPVLVAVVGMFAVLFPALVAGVKRARGADRAEAWHVMLGSASKLAEGLLTGALIYAVVIGSIMQRTSYFAWLTRAARTQVMVSSGLLVFYVLSAVILWPELVAVSSRQTLHESRRQGGQGA